MNLSKKYIIQAISVAANNLRLSSDKIETVAILRSHIQQCEELEKDILKMKSKTELSKFAIKLWEAFKYIKSSNIDFLKISEMFKEHSYNLVMELSNLLDNTTPEELIKIFDSMLDKEEEISVELGDNGIKTELPNTISFGHVEILDEEQTKESVERDELKEELILGGIEESENFNFENFEEEILKPINRLEKLLVVISKGEADENEILEHIAVMKKNAKFSKEVGFTIISEMHTIFYKTLISIHSKKIISDKNLIEALRACLIVIVAVVRSKDVDITNYLNKAESLGEYLKIE